MEIRNYGRVGDAIPVPNLTAIQRESYRRFLQMDVLPGDRKAMGLESVLRETFPITSYDGSMSLEYVRYELGRPRYTPDECRRLRLTYGMPFKIVARLDKPSGAVEEDVYLGEIPIMMGGGEFIINGAERVIVTQLHRSPGVDFSQEIHPTGKRLHSCRIIPERGSWFEITVSKKDALHVRIDQSGKFAATTLLRAMSEEYSTNSDILRTFHETETVKLKKAHAEKLASRIVVTDIVDTETGEVIIEAGKPLNEGLIEAFVARGIEEIEVLKEGEDDLIVNTLMEDQAESHENALLRIYRRLRPGNPPQLEKARELFHEKFFDTSRYRLGRVGRFRLNRKFSQQIDENEMALREEDLVNATKYIMLLRKGQGQVDDIDHLGNRRIRTIDELAADELRKGFLKLRRTVQERMSLKDQENITPRVLINSRTISSAIEYFFGRSELSQVVDQVNPLSQLTHERRLSALGPGGLNRKRAGFDVRDVHPSHYGRICPIETPEGTNIGLIVSLGTFCGVDEYGFLTTPYRKVKNGKLTGEIDYLRADEEDKFNIAPADLKVDSSGKIMVDPVLCRSGEDFKLLPLKEVQYVDVSPKQMVGVSAGLIPFLEHDDANRALMGSNMQRQAVPLLTTEAPIVATGVEKEVARNSGMVVVAEEAGVVKHVDAERIVIADPSGDHEHTYKMRKYVGLNERTCLNQRPIVKLGQKVAKDEVIADGAATDHGELSLGKNALVAFLSFDGCNFEDAILISHKLVKQDVYTSIHIEEFEVEIRETKLGREEFTRDIPNVSERALRNLDEEGIVRVGTRVGPGDILVGKVAPKSKTELSPEEKLLAAIFGRAGEDVKNDSLEVPSGVDGIVIDAQKFSRKMHLSEDRKAADRKELKKDREEFQQKIAGEFKRIIRLMEEKAGGVITDTETGTKLSAEKLDEMTIPEILDIEENFDPENIRIPSKSKKVREDVGQVYRENIERIEALKDEMDRREEKLKRGDELPTGVLEMVKVYVATKRVLSVGDKMAGRHGNKGVIARILPEEDMPFLADGTPIEIILNPLGVPSRMNLGQLFETHLGWAAKALGYRVVTPVFDGATEDQIRGELKKAGLPEDGKVVLYDGRTGEPYEQKVTVGQIYMLKLDHLVDDKVHARATGPYSLITQQPLGGKARFGGQRFGEMEVWALEAYGAAHILQELLTVKSDDVEGRTKIYESMVKGENALEAGTPVSFEVLTHEIKGLGLNMRLEKKREPALPQW
ncbi:MAG TPA: DNA-directed RNA polymerase subunit beta [Planctomycetota bacterium]|nr:DNA-directed RNA polymerase subunit beta [Planctomycetota bacterium]